MKKLYFVRHGLTEMNAAGLWSGTTETPLTDVGRAQAKEAGEHAKTLGIDAIACSTMSRALETAEIIAKQIGFAPHTIHQSSLLIERHFGELEGTPWEPDFNMDGIAEAESIDTLFHRAKLAFEWLESLPYDTILVVSHGSTGRALRHIIHPEIPFSGAGHFSNAEIVEFI